MKYGYRRQIRENVKYTRYEYSTKAVGSELCTLIRLKEIEGRWKQYIRILIAPTETRFLYSLANKESLRLINSRLFSYCDYGFLTICISHKRNTAELGKF